MNKIILEEILNEIKIKGHSQLSGELTKIIDSLFSEHFAKAINKTWGSLKITSLDLDNDTAAEFDNKKNILIDLKKIEKAKNKEKALMGFISHEFIHYLQKISGSVWKLFSPLKKFKYFNDTFISIIKKNIETDLKTFLVDGSVKKNQKVSINDKEILSYLFNNSINWNYLNKKGLKKIKLLFEKYDIFNLEHPIIKENLNRINSLLDENKNDENKNDENKNDENLKSFQQEKLEKLKEN